MAKVEGSNPFIRFIQNPWISGGFVVSRVPPGRSYVVVGTKGGYHTRALLPAYFWLRAVQLAGERKANRAHLPLCPASLRIEDAPPQLGSAKCQRANRDDDRLTRVPPVDLTAQSHRATRKLTSLLRHIG